MDAESSTATMDVCAPATDSDLNSRRSKLWHRLATWPVSVVAKRVLSRLKQTIERRFQAMIGPRDKGVAAVAVAKAAIGVYEGIDLRRLPRFIVMRAAMLRERMLLQHALLGISALVVIYFTISRLEIAGLYRQLREKEYILAPGVQDFTPATAQQVPDSYVQAAVFEYLSQIGNVNPANIDEQYAALASSMNANLRVRFTAEAAEWIERVKRENLSEVLAITRRKVETDGRGNYRVNAEARCDSYVGSEHLGSRSEKIAMELALVRPQADRRWYLEITNLVRSTAKSDVSGGSIR